MGWSRSTKGGLKVSSSFFFFLLFFFSVPTGRKRLEWLSPSLNGCWLHCWDVERVTIPVMIGRLDDAFSPPEIDLDSRKIETGFFSPTLEYYSRPLLSFVVCLSRTFLHERINKIGKNKRRRERERERESIDASLQSFWLWHERYYSLFCLSLLLKRLQIGIQAG